MPERSKDWINQAKSDLNAAESLLDGGSFEWACFASQQAAEKAVKAVIQKLNAVAWGHSVYELLNVLRERAGVEDDLLDCAIALDKDYIPTRYPDSFDTGSPHEYFTRKDAQNAIICSRRIIEFCESLLA